MLVTRDGFGLDYPNHVWLVWAQGQSIGAHGFPAYFLNAPEAGGVFNPFFAFYGGTMYSAAGALSALLGGRAVLAYTLVSLACVGTAYAGLVWLARQLGARTWMAHAPAVAFVTSAYYVTLIYGRGAWSEFVAVSSLPLLAAAGLRVARARRFELGPSLALWVAAVWWSGTHNITLAWGFAVFALLLVALFLARVRLVVWRVAVLVGLGASVNAWFLVPDLLYASQTMISAVSEFSWNATRDFNTPYALFDPLRHVPLTSGNPALYVQAPVWLLVWALVAIGLLRARMPSTWRRATAAVAIVLAVLLALILVEALWIFVPGTLQMIQTPFRLNTYVALLVGGLLIAAVLAVEAAGGRALRVALGAVIAVSVGLCVWQLWVPETHSPAHYDDVREALVSPTVTPRTWYDPGAYLDRAAAVVAAPGGRHLDFDPAAMGGNRVTVTVTPPPGLEPFTSNFGASPKLVRLEGLERVGRDRDGYAVLRRPADAPSGPVRVTLESTGPALTLGLAISVLGLLASLICFVFFGSPMNRRRGTSQPL